MSALYNLFYKYGDVNDLIRLTIIAIIYKLSNFTINKMNME